PPRARRRRALCRRQLRRQRQYLPQRGLHARRRRRALRAGQLALRGQRQEPLRQDLRHLQRRRPFLRLRPGPQRHRLAALSLVRRRQVLAALAGLALLPAAAPIPARRIVALDWGLAETLIAIGQPPVGVPETRTYADWVISPALPTGTADVGLRVEPNLEILQQLAPDLILTIAEHE